MPQERNWSQQAQRYDETACWQTFHTIKASDMTGAPDEGHWNEWQARVGHDRVDDPSSSWVVRVGPGSAAGMRAQKLGVPSFWGTRCKQVHSLGGPLAQSPVGQPNSGSNALAQLPMLARMPTLWMSRLAACPLAGAVLRMRWRFSSAHVGRTQHSIAGHGSADKPASFARPWRGTM